MSTCTVASTSTSVPSGHTGVYRHVYSSFLFLPYTHTRPCNLSHTHTHTHPCNLSHTYQHVYTVRTGVYTHMYTQYVLCTHNSSTFTVSHPSPPLLTYIETVTWCLASTPSLNVQLHSFVFMNILHITYYWSNTIVSCVTFKAHTIVNFVMNNYIAAITVQWHDICCTLSFKPC